MGWLNKILGRQDNDRVSLEGAEALAAIAVAAIAADGYLLEEERRRLYFLLSEIKLFQGYSEAQIAKMVEKYLDIVRRKGTQTLITQAVEALPPQLRATALATATDLLWSDGVFNPKEEEFLTHLKKALEL